jgi:hypothetical protein
MLTQPTNQLFVTRYYDRLRATGFIGMVQVQFEGETFSCAKETLCLPTGEAVIEDLGASGEQHQYWAQFGKLMALSFLFRTLAYLSLRFLHRRKLRFD